MKPYHKIQSVYKRDPETKFKTFLEGDFSVPEFEYLSNLQWWWEEKIDGTNIRIANDGGKVVVRGRTDRAQIQSPLLEWILAVIPPDALDDGLVLYGEGCGPKIQKGGGNYGEDQRFVLFDAKAGDWWLKREDVREIARSLGIESAPVYGRGTLYEAVQLAEEGIESSFGDFEAEGLIMRPLVELKDRGGNRIITKVKCRDFPK